MQMRNPITECFTDTQHACSDALLRCVQKKLLLLGQMAYLDFADIVAKAGFEVDWESMEAPPEVICDTCDDEVIAVGRRRFYSDIVGLKEFVLRGEIPCELMCHGNRRSIATQAGSPRATPGPS